MRYPKSVLLSGLLALGLVSSSCTIVTDPTQTSSDVTSSTSGKESAENGLLDDDQKVSDFASVNYEQLKDDMALGEGEHLSSLATLLGVPRRQQPRFFAFAKETFPLVVTSDSVTPDEMVAALTRELSADPRFRDK